MVITGHKKGAYLEEDNMVGLSHQLCILTLIAAGNQTCTQACTASYVLCLSANCLIQ